jgi:lysophospholipase L1-like esterase
MRRFRLWMTVFCLLLVSCFIIESTYSANAGAAYAATKAASLKAAKASIRIGAKVTIEINNKNAKATYTYKSSDTKVAAVNKSGVVTGKKAGTATITVTETYNKKKTEVGKFQVTVQPNLDYDKMIKASLVSTGNNYRIKNAIEKAENGEEVTIAYIGGSITEGYNAPRGKDYATKSYEYFKKTFGKDDGSNVKFINAGMAGTPSSLGMVRYNRDVVDRSQSAPDIVFIEFAVNDNDDYTRGDAYESLVRNILNADNKPAVVLLFAVFKSKWNLQDRLQPVGEHYNLPMISIKDAVVPELNSGALTNAEFFSDEYHPTEYGHTIMADCINHYFKTIGKEDKAEKDITIPDEAKIGKSFEGIKMLDSTSSVKGISIKAGGFSEKDMVLGTFAGGIKTFPNNWKHTAKSGKNPLKITLECKNLVIVYKYSSSNTFGSVDVYVDGTKTKTYNGYSSGGWNNPVTQIVFNNDKSEKHTIEIKMAPNNESKEFAILAFGYTK